MAVPHLQHLALRVEGCQVDSVAMAHARVVKAFPVVVDGHRAVGDFVASVAINVGHAQVMVALPGIGGPFRLPGVERPAVFQFFTVPVPGGNHRAGVVAATEDAAGVDAVEIAHGGQISF